jgi:6-phosphogluconolactonase
MSARFSTFCLAAAVSSLALIFMLSVLLGCGGGAGSSSSSPGGGTTGSGTGSGTTPGATNGSGNTGTNSGGSSASANGAIVYAVGNTNNGGPFIDARMLDASSGTLTAISGSPFSVDHSQANDVTLSASGLVAYVIVTDFPAGTCCIGPTSLSVFALDPTTGAPTEKQKVAVPSNATLQRVFVHPSGNFVYASYVDFSASSFATGFAIFTVASDGTVTFKELTPAKNGGGSVFDPNGTFVYTDQDGGPASNWGNAACGPIFSDVYGYRIDPTTGALTQVAGSPFQFQRNICEVGNAPSYVTEQIDPAGKDLFLVDVGNQTITEFAIDSSSGALTALPTTTAKTGVSGYSSSAMDPMGRFLYVGSIVDFFTGFSVGSGRLAVLPAMPVQVSPLPDFDEGSTTLAVDPSGTFLFSNENGYTSAFSCCDPDALVGFHIDPSTGSLAQLPAMPRLPGSASGIVIRGGK